LTLDVVVEGLFPRITGHLLEFAQVITSLRRTAGIILAKSLLQYFSATYFDYTISREGPRWWDSDRSRIGAVANLLTTIFPHKTTDILIQVIKNGIETLSLQRACITAISKLGRIDEIVQYILATWTDKLYITHTPVVAQEGPPQKRNLQYVANK
jgi:hypothetical protein